MPRDNKDWNYFRIHSVQAQIADAQNDMMRCLHEGAVDDVVRDRMVMRLRLAADDIERLRLCHD